MCINFVFSWAHCPHGAVSPVTALPGPRLKTSIKKITGLFSCKQLFDIKITDKNIKTDFLAENTELVVQKYKLRGCLAHKALCIATWQHAATLAWYCGHGAGAQLCKI